jgi:ATP-dependent helicase/DNAse subunit B
MRLIERIAAAGAVTVYIARSGLDADEAHAAFRERLLAAGATERVLGDDPAGAISLSILSRDPTTAELRRFVDHLNGGSDTERLAGALFRDSNEPVDAPNVALVSAPDTVREVWEAARACLEWANSGVRFHEMAIVYRNRDPYRALVGEIFNEAGISTYLHDGRLLSTHPLGIRRLPLLDLAADPAFSRQKVMEFLTETRLPRTTAERYNRFRPSQWETYTREAGVVNGIAQWDSRLSRLAAEKTEQSKDERFEWLAAEAERIAELQRFAAEFHAALTEHGDAEASWGDHLAYLAKLAAAYADGVDKVVEALGDLKTLAAVAPRVTFDVFCRAVRDDLESRDASSVLGEPVRLFGREGVAVVDATSLRHLRFRAVYLLGVAERAWPPPPRPDPLLLEPERALLNEQHAGVVPLRASSDDEPLTFWLGVQAAGEHLRLSFSRSDAGGSGKHLPSYFLRAVAEALGGRPLSLADLDASRHLRRFEAGRLASDDLAMSVSEAEYDRGLVKGSIAADDSTAVDMLSSSTPAFGLAVQARLARWGSRLTEYDGVMVGEAALERASAGHFARVKAVSPSRLEMYATCPYRYFMRYTLGVNPVSEPEAIERLDALERGSLIHAILEGFLKQIGRDDPPSLDARIRHLALLREVAAKEAQTREVRGVTGRPLIWEMDKQQIDDDLVRWYDAELKDAARTDLRPGAFEAGFGGPRFGGHTDDESPLSTLDPVVISAGGRELLLQGRIDRIDWDAERAHFRVIDYKTGNYSSKTAFEHGTALQLPVYLRAAAQILGIEALRGEAQYFYVSTNGGYRRPGITGEQDAARTGEFVQILTTIGDGVDGGFFAPNPGKTKTNCTFCDFKDVCDTGIDRIAARKLGDARGAAYRALEDIS